MKKKELRRRLRAAEDRAIRAEGERDALARTLEAMRPTAPMMSPPPIWADPNYLCPPIDITPQITWSPSTRTGDSLAVDGSSYTVVYGGTVSALPKTRYTASS